MVNIGTNSIGFIIDTATEVQSITAKNIDSSPNFRDNEDRGRYIAGLGKIDEEVIIILDVEKLIEHGKMSEIKAEID